jgi:3-oxoacyl-[acyl-carrier protein] reductase/enoyl-[acyl-carrier protein] reductase III
VKNGIFGPAKAALEALTRSLAVELARDGIVVNCVRPGTVATDVLKVRPDFAVKLEEEEQNSPWGRVTTSADAADVVALLCLDEAGWICGQTIVVDGGWSVWR